MYVKKLTRGEAEPEKKRGFEGKNQECFWYDYGIGSEEKDEQCLFNEHARQLFGFI